MIICLYHVPIGGFISASLDSSGHMISLTSTAWGTASRCEGYSRRVLRAKMALAVQTK